MEYEGMPYSWISYYEDCFNTVNRRCSLKLTKEDIRRSVEILKEYNPRFKPRDVEYSSEFLFQKATAHWHSNVALSHIINEFFSGMKLTAKLYDDTIQVLTRLREMGFQISALTNLPSAMPDSLFKADIPQILEILDLYVSSEISGYRKPNKAGLEYIANYFGVNVSDLTFVGDEKLDIDTAKNANCTSVLICRDNHPKEFMQDHTIKSLFQLEEILQLRRFSPA